MQNPRGQKPFLENPSPEIYRSLVYQIVPMRGADEKTPAESLWFRKA
jgi:hypothetical protein